jgi:hypothetical protein
MGLATSEGIELAEDLGMASQQAGDEDDQKKDHDPFDDDQGFHRQEIRPQTTGIAPAPPKENV